MNSLFFLNSLLFKLADLQTYISCHPSLLISIIETPVDQPLSSFTFADFVISSNLKLPSFKYNLFEFWLEVK
jgi:hypothetical protein